MTALRARICRNYSVHYCWLCKQRRQFEWSEDDDGGDWHGSCGHSLWSEAQRRAQGNAEVPKYKPRAIKPPIERFMAKVKKNPDTGCWLWTGAISKTTGYGVFGMHSDSRSTAAHRASLILLRGATLEPGRKMAVDHICGVKACVNPDHLEHVTSRENHQRWRYQSGLMRACGFGHPRTPENTYTHAKTGVQSCRVCRTRARRAYEARKKATAAA